jgi:beta-glucosidase
MESYLQDQLLAQPMIRNALFFVLNLSLTSLVMAQEVDWGYLVETLSFEERTALLVNQLTTEEKISQLVHEAPAIERLKIPSYNWWNEALHGVARSGYATVFPQSISVAASFDKDLLHRIGSVTSDEARAKHHDFIRQNKRGIYTGLTFWSPNINIFRDPRWGRGHETYGEDPYLTGALASAYIKGLQGNDPKYLKTIATSKHFAVHSGPEALRHGFDVDVSDVDLYETYLEAFRTTVVDAKVASIMSAYNRFRGAPASASHFLLEETLRQQWGFDGYVVSDCGAIGDILYNHKIVDSKAEAARMALEGGCDLNCGSTYLSLKDLFDKGILNQEAVNKAVYRLFLSRFKLGMFDRETSVPFSQLPIDIVGAQAHLDLAREAAQKSIVLLKNENQLLPLNKDALKKIAIIGPNADNWESLVGNYHGTPIEPVTFLKGLEHKLSPEVEISYAKGSHFSDEVYSLDPIASVYFETSDGRQGLEASYFSNMNWQGEPVLKRIDDKIDFWWEHDPISKDLNDFFSVRWTGFLKVPESGSYELAVFAKMGMNLRIGEEEIGNGQGMVHETTYARKVLKLEKGVKYPIEVKYYSDDSNAECRLLWARTDTDLQSEAVKLAQEADLSVVVLGLSQRLEGEGGDRKDIVLPQVQTDLLKAVKAQGKPVILVLNAGSALAINWAKEHADAILSVGYPGEQGGNALADVLLGDYNPAGRLPITYYSSLDELPDFESYDMSERTYRYYSGEPLFPFGYGLSYTDFSYSNLKVPASAIAGETVELAVTVTNTGARAGDEVVQVYLTDEKASTPRPQHQLVAFERIHLNPGQQKEVKLAISARHFSLINPASQRVIEQGSFLLYVGSGQPQFTAAKALVQKRITIKGSAKLPL